MAIKCIKQGLAALAVIMMTGGTAEATNILTNFDGAPTGWVTDRYQPNSFADIGMFAGHDNVLEIGIDSADNANNRPAAYSSAFYNTQGMKHAISGGAGDSISAYLYVSSSWSDETNGTVRTGMWGVMTDGSSVSGYPIIGFTNEGGTARFRAWEDTAGMWIDLGAPIQYDAWNRLSIGFTGTTYEFYVNGAHEFTDTTTEGSTGFQDVIMQAYNYDTSSVPGSHPVNYTVHWANVPEPGTLAILGVGLVGLGFARRRKAA